MAADEPESLCEIEPGVYLSAVNVIEADGARKVRFYQMDFPSKTAEPESAEISSKTNSNLLFNSQAVAVSCLGSAAIVMYLYYMHVRMERRRKELCARKYRYRYARKK